MMNEEIVMVRGHVLDIPQFEFPEGYSLRWYQPGDCDIWVSIQKEADLYNEITAALFEREFGGAERDLCNRQCYVVDRHGRAVATSTAWYSENFGGRSFGWIHWLAVRPELQFRGLGKALMSVTCQRLRELGHEEIYLTTSCLRIPAIRLYLGFGFAPQIRNEADRQIWEHLGLQDRT
jgi:GNAT superfamily N-acetyltransferase